ncbi:MAG: glutaredoxin family protein [Chloroflexota bacterium]
MIRRAVPAWGNRRLAFWLRRFPPRAFQWFALVALLWTASFALAGETEPSAGDQAVLEVFVRDGCPHCADAKTFLVPFGRERPWLRIVLRSVDHDTAAREDLAWHSRNAGIWPPGVPTFVIGNRVLVGFASAKRTGPQLAALVDRHSMAAGTVETGLFGTLSVARLGLPLFTLALGLLDGFNPCAMWVLLFLLSLLVHLHNRNRMALIAGTFVLVSGAVYYAFMAAWLNIFLLLGFSTILRWLLGIVALAIGAININDFLVPGRGFSLSIPASAKPGLYARMRAVLQAGTLLPSLSAVIVLAVVVNFIELLCTAGFPAIYTAVLAQQGLSPSAHYAYLGLYILGYVADDALMVTIAVVALSSRKLSEPTGRWLKLLSGVVILALGAIMIFRPEWLV